MDPRQYLRILAIDCLAVGAFFTVASFLLTRICTTWIVTPSSSSCVEYGWGLAYYVLPVGLVFLGAAAAAWASRDAAG